MRGLLRIGWALLALVRPVCADDAVLPGWSGPRAMSDIVRQLEFGPRALDLPGHQKEIDYILQSLATTKAKVDLQSWTEHRPDGHLASLSNIIARFDPENPRRILIGSHFDSIVRAYRDREKPNAVMPGANNSASGVALLLETARALSDAGHRPALGVDLVFFDGEEGPLALGAGDPHWRPLGSPYFVEHLQQFYPSDRPLQVLVFDMVCYRALTLRPEPLSLAQAAAQTQKFWSLGRALAPKIFRGDAFSAPIYDDQVAFARIGIPSFLVIGFDYEPWFNTSLDDIDKCAPASLEAVGQTLLHYLYLQ